MIRLPGVTVNEFNYACVKRANFEPLKDGDAGGVIAAAVANNVPSFSIVRYEDKLARGVS